MRTLALARQENCSTSSRSSRTRPLKDSTNGFLPWRAGLDERRGRLGEAAPVPERVRGQLGAVVAPHMLGGATLARERLQDADGVLGGDVVRGVHRQRLAGELV